MTLFIQADFEHFVLFSILGGPFFDVSESNKNQKTVRGICSFGITGDSNWFCPIQYHSEKCINWFTAPDDQRADALKSLFQYLVIGDVKSNKDEFGNKPFKGGYVSKNEGKDPIPIYKYNTLSEWEKKLYVYWNVRRHSESPFKAQ